MKLKVDAIKPFFFSFLLSVAGAPFADAQQITKTVNNISTGGSSATAAQGDILKYTLVVSNQHAGTIIATRLLDNIPAGTAYVPGSAVLNGSAVADVSGRSPYAINGGYIQSPGSFTGTLAPNSAATVSFNVKVTANGGIVFNTGAVEGLLDSVNVAAQSNMVATNVSADAACNIVYQVTTAGINPATAPEYNMFRTLNTATGTGGAVIFNGLTGQCRNAVTNQFIPNSTAVTSVAALAYDRANSRLYFVNNAVGAPLSFVDLSAATPIVKVYPGFSLESNTAVGYTINRMTFGADGWGYALTSNSRDLIRFRINPATNLPIIERLGTLTNDANNSIYDVLSEGGGDIFADASGSLFLVSGSGQFYRINTVTRVATHLGPIHPTIILPVQSVAVTTDGSLFIGGAANTVAKVDVTTLAAQTINSSSVNVYYSGDFASCGLPILAPVLTATLTHSSASGTVAVGDTVRYTIAVTNSGNLNSANSYVYNYLPSSLTYLSNSTTLNGVAVADVNGTFPFANAGGRVVTSPGHSNIIIPGAANAAVVSYSVVVTDTLAASICNQAQIVYVDGAGAGVVVKTNAACYTVGAAISSSRQAAPAAVAVSAKLTKVQPNPFQEQLKLQVQSNVAQLVQVRLVDFYGRTVLSQKAQLAVGVNALQLTVPAGLSKGIYVLDVSNAQGRLFHEKLLKH